MTKNVIFNDLFSNPVSIKHDFYRRGVKLSETNHIKNYECLYDRLSEDKKIYFQKWFFTELFTT